jgi:CubicO group peptidase (beta-lactamase class C family)
MVPRMKTKKGIKGLQKRNFFVCICLIMILVFCACEKNDNNDVAQNVGINNDTVEKIDELVQSVLKKSKVPIASICIVDHDDTLYRSYDLSSKSCEQEITEDSLFELGSMSKAMTGLAILYLEQQGKLNLDDNINEYLPWFHVKYDGIYRAEQINKEVDLTISNLLHHTSGIPTESISKIPVGQSDDMLEKTIRNINGIKLDYYPGSRYQYATINYDILGLIIEKISNQSYESFISDYILKPLGLNNPYICLKKMRLLQVIL